MINTKKTRINQTFQSVPHYEYTLQENTIPEPIQPKIRKFSSMSCQLLLNFLKFIVFIVLIPIVLVAVYAPILLYRQVVVILAKLFRPDLVGIISGKDVICLDDPSVRCHAVIHCLLTYRGDPDIDLIRKVFHEKVMQSCDEIGRSLYERYTLYYESWMGYSFWKKEKSFKLQDHVKFCEETEALSNKNGDAPITEDTLMTILGPIISKPFRKGMSPWEFLVIRNFIPAPKIINPEFKSTTLVGGDEDGKKFAILFRWDHTIADGFSQLKVVMSNISDLPMNKVPMHLKTEKSCFEKIMLCLGTIILAPYYVFKEFYLEIDQNFWHMKESQLTHDCLTIRSETISMEKVKRATKRFNVSTTATLLTAIGGGIRNFMKETGHEHEMPEIMRCMAPIPWIGHPMNGLVNHWAISFPVIPINIKCLGKRLQAAEDSVKFLKTSFVGYLHFCLHEFDSYLPIWVLKKCSDFVWAPTVLISNFPTSSCSATSYGKYPLEDVTPFLPLLRGTICMGIGVLSYNGGLRISVTGDKKIIPTMEKANQLVQCINQEFKTLLGE